MELGGSLNRKTNLSGSILRTSGGGGGGDITLDTLSVSENGTYTPQTGHAYKKAIVSVPVPTIDTLTVSQNGTYTATSGHAYGEAVVSVPNSYAAGDEGKVVNNGALAAQTAHATVTQNGTVDTTLNNSVVVAVPQPAGTKQISIQQNGTTTEDVSSYASAEIAVNVSGGGGQFTLLTSGNYTQAADATTMTIPFSTTGTPLFAYVVASEALSGVAQAYAWVLGNVSQLPNDVKSLFPHFDLVRSKQANGNDVTPGTTIGLTQTTYGLHDDYILVAQQSNTYPIKANTYSWYVWGVSA